LKPRSDSGKPERSNYRRVRGISRAGDQRAHGVKSQKKVPVECLLDFSLFLLDFSLFLLDFSLFLLDRRGTQLRGSSRVLAAPGDCTGPTSGPASGRTCGPPSR
jgi:hypothetical protein